jgi:hypothetical protein
MHRRALSARLSPTWIGLVWLAQVEEAVQDVSAGGGATAGGLLGGVEALGLSARLTGGAPHMAGGPARAAPSGAPSSRVTLSCRVL